MEHVVKLKENLKTPDFTDLQGVAAGIARLQKLYNLHAADMAEGVIGDIETKYDQLPHVNISLMVM